MRVIQNEQMTIGEVDISKINFNYKSRDDIPKILKGLQFIYTHVELRTAIFQLLQSQPNREQIHRAPRHDLVDDSGWWRDPA